MAMGPTLGGIIGASLGWRWIFLANLPFCALITLMAPRLVAEMRDDTDKRLDWPGIAILTLALGLAIEAILQARHAPIRLAIGLAVSAGLIAWFAARQRRQVRPMLDPIVFASRSMVGVTILLLAVSVGYVGAFVGMALIGMGAALSHPQLSGAVIALAPPEVSGMASALTVVARQAGFALGVATLGALTPVPLHVSAFVRPFGAAAAAAAGGVLACLLLPSRMTVGGRP